MTIEPIKVTLKDRLTEQDYAKLIRHCLPLPEGGMYKKTDKGYEFNVHPSHIRAVKMFFTKLNMTPQIELREKPTGTVALKSKDGRADMNSKFTVVEKGIIVTTPNGEYFVPNSYIDILYNIIKEAQVISPRQVWAKLADAHSLFPEVKETIKLLYNYPNLPEADKQRLVKAQYEHLSSLFEGLRVRKKENPTLNYYVLYWYPSQFLKKEGLIDQLGTGDLFLKQGELRVKA